MAFPLPLLGAAAVAAYLLLSGKSASAAQAPAPSGGGGGGGGGAPYGGGGGGGGGSPGGTNLGPPGSVTTAPDGTYGGTILGPGGSTLPSSQWDTTPSTDTSTMNAAVATGTDASASGYVGALAACPSCTLPDGSEGVWSMHPNVLAATGGRGGWVPAFDGCDEGYAPPGGLPIY